MPPSGVLPQVHDSSSVSTIRFPSIVTVAYLAGKPSAVLATGLNSSDPRELIVSDKLCCKLSCCKTCAEEPDVKPCESTSNRRPKACIGESVCRQVRAGKASQVELQPSRASQRYSSAESS